MNRTLLEWCEIFGVLLIDPDGFRHFDWRNTPIHLTEFLNGIVEATIGIANFGRYSVLNDLLNKPDADGLRPSWQGDSDGTVGVD